MSEILIKNLLQTFIIVIEIYIYVIIISALMSWFRPNPYNPFVQFINSLTLPAYNFIRRLVPTTFGMIDLAPMILLLMLIILQNILAKLI